MSQTLACCILATAEHESVAARHTLNLRLGPCHDPEPCLATVAGGGHDANAINSPDDEGGYTFGCSYHYFRSNSCCSRAVSLCFLADLAPLIILNRD
jgi:hypothetical protein